MLLAPSEGQLVLVHVFLLRGLSEPSKSRDALGPLNKVLVNQRLLPVLSQSINMILQHPDCGHAKGIFAKILFRR